MPTQPKRALGEKHVRPRILLVEGDCLAGELECALQRCLKVRTKLRRYVLAIGHAGIGRSIVGIRLNGGREQALRLGYAFRGELVEVPVAALDQIVTGEAPARRCPTLLYFHDLRLDRSRDARRDVVLNREEIAELAIVAFRPNVVPGQRVDELGSDADPVPGLADAPFQHVAGAELLADLLDVD